MDIPAIVKELVFTGGSLTVPGLGKFSIFRMPAEMDISARVITPPSRIIQFDGLKTRDDGKLTSLLAERYNLNTSEAASAVNKWVKSLREEMSEKGRAVIAAFGTLEPGEKGISFKDDPFIMYSSLLPSVTFRTAKRDEPQTFEKIHEKPALPAEARKRKLLIPALIILLVTIVTSLFLTGLHREIINLSRSESGNAKPKNQNRIVFGRPPVYNDSLSKAISDDLDKSTLKENALSYEEPQPSIPEPSERPAEENTVTAAVTSGSLNTAVRGYHIIAGSYVVPDNAEKQKYLLEARGFKTIILPPQGNYYMVSLGSYTTLEQVTEVMNSLRNELDIPLWVKKI